MEPGAVPALIGEINSRMDFTPKIENVIFNNPATAVFWSDGTKTVVKCQPGDTYSKETGLAMCISKKFFGNKSNFNEIFKKWIPEETAEKITVEEMREKLTRYCIGRPCWRCLLHILPISCPHCGNFKTRNAKGKYIISDNNIKVSYAIAFRANSGGQ